MAKLDTEQPEYMVPSHYYKHLMGLLAEKLPAFPTVIQRLNKTNELITEPLIYRVKVHEDQLSLHAFIMHTVKSVTNMGTIDLLPEVAFVYYQEFWVASPERLFENYDKDKDVTPLVWATCYEREPKFKSLCVNLNESVFGYSFSIKYLNSLDMTKVATLVAPTPVAGGTISTTLGDLPLDTPPLNASVSFHPTKPFSDDTSKD